MPTVLYNDLRDVKIGGFSASNIFIECLLVCTTSNLSINFMSCRGYLSLTQQLDLFETANIVLETPMRMNQKNYKKQTYIFRKSRKRIETLFSQLCDQFMIRRNYAKSFQGFKTRILAKITALTLVQYINKFIFGRPINNVKIQII